MTVAKLKACCWGWLSDGDLGEVCRFARMNAPRVRELLSFLDDLSALRFAPERGPLSTYTGRILPADVTEEDVVVDLAAKAPNIDCVDVETEMWTR